MIKFGLVLFIAYFTLATSILLDGFVSEDIYKYIEKVSAKKANFKQFAARNVTWNTIPQPLDHFNPNITEQFEQRYLAIDEFYRPGGKVLIILPDYHKFKLTGISEDDLTNSLPVDLARVTNSYVFLLEQRYYGESIPVQNLTTENLQWFTIEQAIADTVNFIDFVRSTIAHDQDITVLLAGGQYGGSLGVWLHQAHPGVVDGVWASSSSLLSVYNNSEYLENLGETYRAIGGDECYNRIELGMKYVESLVLNNSHEELTNRFKLCSLNQPDRDLKNLFWHIISIFIVNTELGRDEILEACSSLNEGTPEDALSSYIQTAFNLSENACLAVDANNTIKFYQQTDLDSVNVRFGVRQHVYQMCHYLGGIYTTTENQPFGSTLTADDYYKYCEAAFGSSINQTVLENNINKFNSVHGGLRPNVTDVIFTNGELDARRALSIQTPLNGRVAVFNIEGEPRNSDLTSASPNDSEQLAIVKREIESIIREHF